MNLDNMKGNVFIPVLLLIIIGLLGIIAYPIVKDYLVKEKIKDTINKNIAYEGQSAIASIRSAYRVHFDSIGSYEGYSVENAIEDCYLDNSTILNWTFEVNGNPPDKFIATSTYENPIGHGKTISYNVETALYHGYGID